ncbi:hypothetical protein JZ751_007071 [Albula glossodonta]|uniref:Ig-like domain-containing protein n=1 Tax=Albula glossodonta TaxID=121402 RepID=A0A8T2P2Q7_9TELE|nr:hypothetical protein JZ751_007071 [Albula glossodonta]
MNTLYRYIHTLYSWLLFCRFSVCKGSMEVLVGITGDRITLPCSYNVRTHGRSSVCWGRDKVPMSKCSKTIISTDGDEVNFRESDRYQLLSGVTRGNVSLTIINVTENDSGTYGCRAEISGPFNDLKINFHLNVVKDQRKLQFSTAETTTDNPTPERKNSASVWSTASLSQTTIQHKGVFGSIAYPPEARVPNGGGEICLVLHYTGRWSSPLCLHFGVSSGGSHSGDIVCLHNMAEKEKPRPEA